MFSRAEAFNNDLSVMSCMLLPFLLQEGQSVLATPVLLLNDSQQSILTTLLL